MSGRRSSSRNQVLSLFQSTGRDFVFAFMVFLLLFALLAPESSTIQSLSAFSAIATSPDLTLPFASLTNAPFESGGYHFADFVKSIRVETPTTSPSQFTMILAAAVFAAMVAFNLAFFRHLRRVHASSRRGAWRGN
ncbi:MAG: hypothetical protein AAF709_19785 [Pseudomonadota bacterium]